MFNALNGQEGRYPSMLRPLLRALAEMYGGTPPLDNKRLSEVFRGWLGFNAATSHTKFQAAAHEAGHVAAYAAAGVPLVKAEIFQDLSRPGNWLGRTEHTTFLAPLVLVREPDVFSLLTILTLAGPIAEELVGDGIAMANFPELLRASAFSARAAELASQDWVKAWTTNVHRAAAIVVQCAADIEALAQHLERRSYIEPKQAKVKRILNDIGCSRNGGALLSFKAEKLLRSLLEDVPCASALFKASA